MFRAKQRAIRISVAAIGCVLAAGLATPTGASAAQADFCGYLRPSTTAFPGGTSQSCFSSYQAWTWVSNAYYGGGNIRRMRAGGCPASGCWAYAYADYATSVHICYTGWVSGNNGVINQMEDNGASHTIYGHVDDSPNHTNCYVIA